MCFIYLQRKRKRESGYSHFAKSDIMEQRT